MNIVQYYDRLTLPEMEVLEMEGKTFKEYAREARKRMKSGFWQKMRAEKEQAILEALRNGESIAVVEAQFKRKFSAQFAQKRTSNKFWTTKHFMKRFAKCLNHPIC